MSQDKGRARAQAGAENSATNVGNETVLDYLWSPEAALADGRLTGPHAQEPEPPAQGEAAGDALEDALSRYSSWLSSWGETGSSD